jgi:N-acetylglucosaminyldiphosphoundecaprenol N-acetyl-beta-D-mannosaminyltransferase
MERKTVKLLGFNIDTFDFETALNYAKDLLESKKGGQIITINPEMIEFALKNPNFADILTNADIVIPDGVGVQIGLRIKGVNAKRIAGIEYSYRLIEECAKKDFPIALIGAKPHILEKTCEKLKSDIANLNIAYTMDGYFQDRESVLNALAENKPRFVLVALGSPRQEEFIKEARKLLPEALMIGVGGSFDVWSGEVKRAPVIYQKLGLEWVYRTVKEPWRLKRIFPTLPRFLFRVLFS